MILRLAMVAVAAVVAEGCSSTGQPSLGDRIVGTWRQTKVELDLTRLDQDGRRGPPGGKVSVAYEFCIPNRDACRAEVCAIAPNVQFMPGSRGRIGAGKDECLCIGTTGKDFRDVLKRLAELPYVKRIIECHFE
jgi:hypothetical protein